MVRGDLCERAAQRMPGDVHWPIPIFLSQFGCLLGERKGIAKLSVNSGGDHRSVDAAIKYCLAIELGAAMGDDNLLGPDIQGHNALIATGCVTSR